MACNQTYVAVLQELCMKRKWNPPLYDVIDQGGPSNDPSFEVSVTLCNGVKATGRGRQKQAAKHDAARKALLQLEGKALTDGTECSPEKSSYKALINPHEDIGSYNAVGELQELCLSKHLPSPIYTVVGDEGEPHEKLFTYKCCVSEQIAYGRARKKQHAKHLAAADMLNHLKDNLKQILDDIPNDPTVSAMYSQKGKDVDKEKDKEHDMEVIERYKNLKDLKDEVPTAPVISPGVKFASYHTAYAKLLEDLSGILDKPVIKKETDPVKKVQMVADELHLKVSTTVDTGKDQSHIVFIQLDTNPTTVQVGHHKDQALATRQAASNLLDFLQVMSP